MTRTGRAAVAAVLASTLAGCGTLVLTPPGATPRVLVFLACLGLIAFTAFNMLAGR